MSYMYFYEWQKSYVLFYGAFKIIVYTCAFEQFVWRNNFIFLKNKNKIFIYCPTPMASKI